MLFLNALAITLGVGVGILITIIGLVTLAEWWAEGFQDDYYGKGK